MRDLFPGHFPLSEDEFGKLWADATIVVDANILLRFYRYKQETADDILKVLEKLKDRLWIPFQVGLEYNKNRLSKMKEAANSYRHLIKTYKDCLQSAKNQLEGVKDFGIHPAINLEERLHHINQYLEDKLSEIDKEYDARPTGEMHNRLHVRIGELYFGKVGHDHDSGELQSLYSEGEERYKREIPPGYADGKKKKQANAPEREVYGDYIIWQSIIDYANKTRSPVIFVTEDAKEDWWLREGGRTIGPRPELRQEFRAKSGLDIYIYRIETFLEHAKTRLGAEVSAASVEEVKRDGERVRLFSKSLREAIRRRQLVTARRTTATAMQLLDHNLRHERERSDADLMRQLRKAEREAAAWKNEVAEHARLADAGSENDFARGERLRRALVLAEGRVEALRDALLSRAVVEPPPDERSGLNDADGDPEVGDDEAAEGIGGDD
jgi:predicted nucleic-acid-binding protein